MKKSLLLVFLLSVSFAYSLHLVNPDTLWTYGPLEGGFSTYPAVHPNGNILIGDTRKEDVVELNGLTGEIIRRIPVTVLDYPYYRFLEISNDGKLLLASGKLIDYNTGEVINSNLPSGAFHHFLPLDNNNIILVPTDKKIVIYNRENGKTTEYPVNFGKYGTTAMDVSPDGRYIALAQHEFQVLVENPHTHFFLIDALTMQLISELEDVPEEGRVIEFIQFSENSKYVGYGHVTAGTFKATIFTTDPPYKKWEFSNWKMPGYGMNSVGFIGDEYALLSSCGSPVFSIIWDLAKEMPVYQTDKYATYYPVNNKYSNSILVGDNFTGALVALSIDAIVSVAQDINHDNPKLIVNYQNGILNVTNLPTGSDSAEVSLLDINGKMIYQSVQPLIEDRLQIQIGLISGVYILQMQTGNKQYSQKFIISN